MSKVWFITGTSKGFGRIWAEAALQRGDRVVATARRPETLDELRERHGDAVLALALDVTDKAQVDAVVQQAHAHFGRLDVVVNNAGFGLFGAIEEISEAQARAQIETNVFGALWVTQAALPFLREQGSGHIIQVSSIGGVQAFPTLGLYHASKWALEGLSQSLAGEVNGLGIHVTLVEPTGYPTDWSGPSSVVADPLPAYDEIRAARQANRGRWTPADPLATGPAILRLVDAEQPPLRVFFGETPLSIIEPEYARRLESWHEWQWLAELANGEAAA